MTTRRSISFWPISSTGRHNKQTNKEPKKNNHKARSGRLTSIDRRSDLSQCKLPAAVRQADLPVAVAEDVPVAQLPAAELQPAEQEPQAKADPVAPKADRAEPRARQAV